MELWLWIWQSGQTNRDHGMQGRKLRNGDMAIKAQNTDSVKPKGRRRGFVNVTLPRSVRRHRPGFPASTSRLQDGAGAC